LGGADDVSGEPGGGANDAVIGSGRIGGIDAVRELGAGDESRRQQRDAFERIGDDQRDEDVRAPNVPAPTSAGQVASKGYVDQALSNVGAGNYLPTAGGTMTGPITLPGVPPSLVAPATVLYDGVLQNAPGFCTYGLVNAANMQCGVAYTYVTHISLALVRSALPNAGYVTVPVGSLSDGAQCAIVSSTSLDFYPQYVLR
jgi:hypothetical protein